MNQALKEYWSEALLTALDVGGIGFDIIHRENMDKMAESLAKAADNQWMAFGNIPNPQREEARRELRAAHHTIKELNETHAAREKQLLGIIEDLRYEIAAKETKARA